MPACSSARRRCRALALLLVVLGACGGGNDDASSTTTSEAAPTSTAPVTVDATASTELTATTTTEPATDEEAILAAVDGFFEVLFESSAPPDPTHPDLERYLTGAQLERSRKVVEDRASLGQAVRRAEPSRYDHRSRISLLQSRDATVQTCETDDLVLYDATSGTVLNDAVYTRKWSLDLRPVNGEWKVHEGTILHEERGVVPCDL